MIKMKNGDLMLFKSDVFKGFYNDSERRFPIADAFKLEEILTLISDKIQIHSKLLQDIFKKYNAYNESGIVDTNKMKKEDIEKMENDINELNALEIEINADPIQIKESWPNISMVEISILKHILK
jgi:hypothetical protein